MASTPTSPTLPFPNTSSPAIKSNPHPYAIKTTSTGILTRSNSTTSSNSTSHAHHFVPPSPTKRNSIHDSPARRPNTTHKYSRSLNSNELPRPLPIPPNFPSSSSSQAVSPSTAEFDSQVHQDAAAASYIVSRRDRRADTLPSVSQPDLISGGRERANGDDLPDDPRLWTPSQLSTYLASSLRVTSGDVSPLVVQDMAVFVRTQKMNGRKFLRLTEGDLDKYGLNQRWQSALLGVSRTLRQDSLRGRIWTSPYPSTEDVEDQDNDNGNYSSTSSISSSGSMSELHRRGRPGNQSGRVKGMIASFERRGPSRSVSPTKDTTAAVAAGSSISSTSASGRRSISPAKPTTTASPDFGDFGFVVSRPRPQSDIFPSRSSFTSSYNTNNNDRAMVVVSPEIVNAGGGGGELKKAEPRLLPFPPPQHTSPQPQPQLDPSTNANANLVSSFGPYALPLLPQPQHNDDTGLSFLPPGVLPFSPQSTGNPDPHLVSMQPQPQPQPQPIYAPTPQQPFDMFDSGNGGDENDYHGQGVRPLPLPPHPGQYYQHHDGSSQGYTTTSSSSIMDPTKTGSADGGEAFMSPFSPHGHGQYQSAQQASLPPHPQVPVLTHPHVQVQIQEEEAPALVPDPSFSSFLSSHHHHHQHQQQYLPIAQPQQPVHIIHAPQPRPGHSHGHGQGRDSSPTKILEEKLEELLEPRPRSRVIPTQPGSHPHSHPHSRPRSRIPSMNLTLTPGSGVGGGDEKRANGNLGSSSSSGGIGEPQQDNTSSLNTTPTAPSHQHHNPRTRVISLSHTRSHHRLSGVEVWGESHRHMSIAPSDDDDLEVSNEGGGAEVKDLVEREEEEEEENIGIGIEAVLEKDVPAVVVIPEEPSTLDPTTTTTTISGIGGGGHGKEASGGSISSTLSSRTGSLREPKSAVITLVNVGHHHHRRSSSSIGRVRKLDVLPTPPASSSSSTLLAGREEEEEQSIEALLVKAGFGDGSIGSARGGGGGGTKERKRIPMNGAEAWEMMGYVETVKHVDGTEAGLGEGAGAGAGASGSGGLSRSIEDIFSPIPAPVLPSNQTESTPPQQAKTKLEPKEQLKTEDTEKERELEKSIGETRRMVEEIRCRLDKVEQWISDNERSRQYQQQSGTEKRRGTATINGNLWPVDVMRKVLSASRIPGMLGLSAWLGSSASAISTSTSPSASTSASGSTPSTSTQTKSRNSTSTRSTLILRFAKLGLSLSTYAVLFGIGVCVVMLRMLGKRPGGAIFARLGARGGMVNGNGVPKK